MELERRENESALQHHKRLIYGKLEDKTLADVDYSELSEYVYGQAYSSDVARRMCYGSKRTLDLMAEEAEQKAQSSMDGGLLADLDARRIAFEKERQKFYDQRSAYNKMIREQARDEELREMIRDCVQSGSLAELRFDGTPEFAGGEENTLLVSLNDLHYGADINNAWCRYNSSVCAEMMDGYLKKILSVAETHRSGHCIVWAAGDMISGLIHRSIQVTNRENVIEQVMGVSELIAQFLSELSRHFYSVRFVSVAGNHSRIEPNKENALTAERLDDLVEWYLAARLQNFENVIIDDTHRLDPTIGLFQVYGKNYVLVHGDFDPTPARIQSLQTMIGEPVHAVLCGHLHHNQVNVVQGIRTVMAGSFQGMDSLCVERRIYGKPEQMICVCDGSGIVCYYDVPLSK